MVEFLRDYPDVFPVGVAVLNGALAAISAHYPFRSARRKLVFIAVVLVLSLSAVLAAVYSQHLIIVQKTEERTWWGMVRNQLGTFIAEDNVLMQQCLQQNMPSPPAAAETWAGQIEAYLRSVLGESYVNRFRSDVGLLPLETSGTQSPESRQLWHLIYFRVARLEQFSEELPPYTTSL